MSPFLRELFQILPRRCEWVVTSPKSAQYPDGKHQISERQLLQYLKRILKGLALCGHLHTFRHSFISDAVVKGISTEIIRQWVGHVDAEIMRVYTHISDNNSQQAMQQLAAAEENEKQCSLVNSSNNPTSQT